jgi:anti-sigma factor RsiW
MKACPDRQDTLMLDVYNELRPEERSAWQRHLASCRACREERERLAGLLNRVQAAAAVPRLSSAAAESLTRAVIRDLEAGRKPRRRFFGLTITTLPALAAAALTFFVVGWFGVHKLTQKPQEIASTPSRALMAREENVIVQNIELMENLDLLQDIEVVEKLVRVVDQRDIAL